jgi:hypothetical protein
VKGEETYVFVDSPIEDVIVLETLTDEQISEDLAKVRVVRLIIKPQRTGVVKVDSKFVRETTAENFGRSGHFLLHNTIILLLLCSSLQALPRQRPTAKVKHDVTKRFHIVTTGLL